MHAYKDVAEMCAGKQCTNKVSVWFNLSVPCGPLQTSVFLDLGQGILDNALQGYNATLLAYGQTGSGKSYSMVGYGPNKGLIPTLCERLFQSIRSMQDSRQCQVCQSYSSR